MMDKFNRFVSEFVNGITRGHGDRIEYILLTGSGARGDFRPGKSDIDLIVKVKAMEHVQAIRSEAIELFWALDSKYGMQQKAARAEKASLRLISLGEPASPISVFSLPPGRARAMRYFNLFYKQMVREGRRTSKLLYGMPSGGRLFVYEDPLSLLLTYDLVTASLALLMFPLSPERSLGRAIRSSAYTFEPYASLNNWQGAAAREALTAKHGLEEAMKAWPIHRKATYCLKAPFMVLANNVCDLWTKFRTGRLPEELINENKNLR